MRPCKRGIKDLMWSDASYPTCVGYIKKIYIYIYIYIYILKKRSINIKFFCFCILYCIFNPGNYVLVRCYGNEQRSSRALWPFICKKTSFFKKKSIFFLLTFWFSKNEEKQVSKEGCFWQKPQQKLQQYAPKTTNILTGITGYDLTFLSTGPTSAVLLLIS